MSRVLENAVDQITVKYTAGIHNGVDDVKYKSKTCNIIAHTSGTVVFCQTGQKNNTKATGNASYGNCVKIKHANGYYTLYAHLKTVKVKLGQVVKKGDVIGYMGNTGCSFGAHLHFEVRNTKDVRIDPTPYLDADLPAIQPANVVYTYAVDDLTKKCWLPEVKTSAANDYAGNIGNPITALRISSLTYRVHDKKKNKWLPAVSGDNTYAGNIGNEIDGVAIKSDTLKYRVHLKKDNRWLNFVDGYNINNEANGFAGNLGDTIDAVQIVKK